MYNLPEIHSTRTLLDGRVVGQSYLGVMIENGNNWVQADYDTSEEYWDLVQEDLTLIEC